ncbi:MAG: redox-sensitive transcriptional activator SoxR [Hyphomonas sp.]|jgi:MerR family transcriptional regulator, redox-sensitive transcriptional activator SoxR
MHAQDVLLIGDIAARTGLSVSAIRFYEAKGLIAPIRSSGGQRRFRRADIRRLSFIRIAQKLGLSIERIAGELGKLPSRRTPTAEDWTRISRSIRAELDAEIASLMDVRNRLDGCIGCGCLSLKKCALYNADDRVAATGSGPRYVLGEKPTAA